MMNSIFSLISRAFPLPAWLAGMCLAVMLSASQSQAETAPRLYPRGTLPLLAIDASKDAETTLPRSSDGTPVTPGIEPIARSVTEPEPGPPKTYLDLITRSSQNNATATNDPVSVLQQKLERARYFRTSRLTQQAEPILIELLGEDSPQEIQQAALLELAAAAQDNNDLTRSQQIYSQFLSKWPNDLRVPEILLRQGLIFRHMGLNNLALTKFYGVMTSALVLKNDQLDYYGKLVQDAQVEIAETHYALGKFNDAAEFFSRLRKQTNFHNKSIILYKLTRCHSALGHHPETVANAQEYLVRFAGAPEQPEVRFYLADALKQLGRNSESLQQVLLLLQEQRQETKYRPEAWAYWQQRAGNLIGNQLYREGDYAKALEVYINLAQLDSSPAWKLPVNYQIAMTYERLWQPRKASETYAEILAHEKELADTASPSLKAVFDMARWRMNFIQWQSKAEDANQQFQVASTNVTVTASLPGPNADNP